MVRVRARRGVAASVDGMFDSDDPGRRASGAICGTCARSPACGVAFQGVPRAANYAATKVYVQSFAEALRLELKPLGVDVIASAPGPIRSGFATRASMTMGLAQTPRDVAGATLASLGRRGIVRPRWLSTFLEASLMFLPSVGARTHDGHRHGRNDQAARDPGRWVFTRRPSMIPDVVETTRRLS